MDGLTSPEGVDNHLNPEAAARAVTESTRALVKDVLDLDFNRPSPTHRQHE
eukprot:gene55542-61731_t